MRWVAAWQETKAAVALVVAEEHRLCEAFPIELKGTCFEVIRAI